MSPHFSSHRFNTQNPNPYVKGIEAIRPYFNSKVCANCTHRKGRYCEVAKKDIPETFDLDKFGCWYWSNE